MGQAEGLPVDEKGNTVLTDSIKLDTIPDSSLVVVDTIPGATDNLSVSVREVALSKDSLDAPVDYNAKDSMIYDIAGQKIHLYGNASVSYTNINLNAAHIIFDWSTNIVTARGLPDSTGRPTGLPEFSDGGQSFTADSMRYNFITRKGIVYDVTTKQNDIVVHGSRSKFIATSTDSTDEAQNIIYSKDALFTTCTHDHPHFGIRSTKQKVIPNKLVVVGPSNLEIMDVPTPVWLPFGFFPLSEGRSTGLIFPRDYQYSPQWGFGLEGVGWFFPLGDHFNLTLTSNLYVKGRWGVQARSDYVKRYKYNGSLDFGYNVNRVEDNEGNVSRPRSFQFKWSHRQDRAAHPTNTFGGSVNIQTNGYQSIVFNDERVLNNQLNSNLSFNKNWRDKPLTFNASFNHNQNTATNKVTITFPNLKFQTQALYPFKRKEKQGQEKWYESITFRYQSEARNRFQATDTTLFSQQTLEDAQFGVRQSANAGTSFKLFKYINLNPAVNYEEVWYMRTLEKSFEENLLVDTLFNNGITDFDTTSFGIISEDRVTGFESFREFNTSLSLTTQIFGTRNFEKGWLRGVRHTLKPSLSFNFSPDYESQELKYTRAVRDSLSADGLLEYNIFEGGIYGIPSTAGRQMALNYSFNNIFEAKLFSKKSTEKDSIKRVKLFDNIVVNGNHNFAADSLKWSQVNISGTTRLFKGMTTFRVRTRLDPYAVDENNKRIDVFQWQDQGRFLRYVSTNAAFNTNITVGKIRALFMGKEEEVVEDLEEEALREPEPEEEDFLSLFENFRISHNFTLDFNRQADGTDTLTIGTHSINCNGSINLTDKWRVNIGNFGYDFVRKGVTYPSLGFSRDLHCWQMGANWQPTRGTYSFFIQVKPGSLDFINIPYNRNNADARAQF
jgi:hypothetical protein